MVICAVLAADDHDQHRSLGSRRHSVHPLARLVIDSPAENDGPASEAQCLRLLTRHNKLRTSPTRSPLLPPAFASSPQSE